jgi:hypothetical protein
MFSNSNPSLVSFQHDLKIQPTFEKFQSPRSNSLPNLFENISNVSSIPTSNSISIPVSSSDSIASLKTSVSDPYEQKWLNSLMDTKNIQNQNKIN